MVYIVSVRVLSNDFHYKYLKHRKFVLKEAYILHAAFHSKIEAENYIREANKEFVKTDLKLRMESGKRIDYIRSYKLEGILV